MKSSGRGVLPSVEPFQGSSDDWDAAVARLEGGNFCHLSGWRRVMEDVLRHETEYVAAHDAAGAMIGLLPLVRVRSRIFGDYLLSMPFMSYGGPLGTPEARTALVDHAVARARDLGVDLMELRCRDPVGGDLPVSDRKVTVLKELPATSEELWESGIRAKLRSQVRRPMKEGMVVKFGADQLERFYRIFSTTMRDLGTPTLPRAFFEAIAECFPEEVVFAVVELDGAAMAAGCGFHFGDELEITWAGALREHSRLAPNMLLYWSMMEETIRRGGTVFNFGRCSPGSGTHRFKLQWGSEDHPLPWAQWTSGGVAATPSPDSAKFRLATSVWRRLPLGLANAIGPLVSRSLP